MDEYTKDYIASRERSLILHLGCGLDGRFWRMDSKPALWFDLDYPEVIDIKKRLLHQPQGLEYIPSSVLDYKWLENLQATKEEVLVIAEGLFMYFSEEEIRSLFKALCQKFNKVTFLFDVYSKITARIASRHPSLKETGAVIQWGLDDPLEMEAYVEGLKYLKTIYFTDRRAIEGLPLKFRCQFKVAGRFKTIREAHRIWVLSFNNQSSGS